MNKKGLVDFVCRELQTTKASSETIVNIVLQGVQEGVSDDGVVSIAGFGTWSTRRRAARSGRNPQTGNPIQIPASTTISFRPAKAWKDTLNHRDRSRA